MVSGAKTYGFRRQNHMFLKPVVTHCLSATYESTTNGYKNKQQQLQITCSCFYYIKIPWLLGSLVYKLMELLVFQLFLKNFIYTHVLNQFGITSCTIPLTVQIYRKYPNEISLC